MQYPDIDYDGISIPTYIIPSYEFEQFRSQIPYQFEKKKIFDLKFVSPAQLDSSIESYWRCIKEIVQSAIVSDEDVIVICEDNHSFTEVFSEQSFLRDIINAHRLGAGILCGGIDDIEVAVPIANGMFWISAFKSCSFLLLFKSVFEKILSHSIDCFLTKGDLFRELTSNKIVLFPPISVQTNFQNNNSCPTDSADAMVSSRLDKILKTAKLLAVND